MKKISEESCEGVGNRACNPKKVVVFDNEVNKKRINQKIEYS